MRWMNSNCSRSCSAARCSSVTSCTTPMTTCTPSRGSARCTRERIQRTSPSGRCQRYSTSTSWAPALAWLNRGRSSARMPLTARWGSTHSCRSNPAMSHSPGDHRSTVSPGSSMRRQWPVRARLSMVLNNSVCSRNSRRTSSSARSDAASAMRKVSASVASRSVTRRPSPATRRADTSQASLNRPDSRSTWRHSSGAPPRATPCSWSSNAVPASKPNTSPASAPGTCTASSPLRLRAAALAASSSNRPACHRNCTMATGTASSRAGRRTDSGDCRESLPARAQGWVNNSDEITVALKPLNPRDGWTCSRRRRPRAATRRPAYRQKYVET